MTLLLLKLTLVPALIAAVTLIGRRYGPRVSGLVAGMPIIGGPIVAFLAVEQGPAFAAQGAVGALAAVAPLVAGCIAYAWCARTRNWPIALAASWAVYIAGAALLALSGPGIAGAAALAVASLAAGSRAYPPSALPTATPPRGGMLLRMAAALALLLALTGAAARLGPTWSGVLTSFPVAASILPVFAHREQGPGAASLLLQGLTLGLAAYAAFMGVFALLAPRMHLAAVLALAVAAALAVQGMRGALAHLRLRPRPAAS